MKIEVLQTTNIVWKAKCNSFIDEKIVDKFENSIFVLNTDIVPQVNEILMINGKEYVVEKVKRNLIYKSFGVYEHNSRDGFKIVVKPENIHVDYYDYMKKYTHACDQMKTDDDPTKDLSKLNDEIVWPKTLKEWTEKIKNL